MLTVVEINRKAKAGNHVYARVPGFKAEQLVRRARVGLRDALQVQIMIDGEPRWRNVEWEAVRVADGQ